MIKRMIIICTLIVSTSQVQAFDKDKLNLSQTFWGSWEIFNSNSKCSENYQFVAPEKFLYQAENKKLTGDFVVLRSSNKEMLDQLVLEIHDDNGEESCGGDTNNYKGQNSSFFLKWLSSDSAEICLDSVGQSCLGLYLNRNRK